MFGNVIPARQPLNRLVTGGSRAVSTSHSGARKRGDAREELGRMFGLNKSDMLQHSGGFLILQFRCVTILPAAAAEYFAGEV